MKRKYKLTSIALSAALFCFSNTFSTNIQPLTVNAETSSEYLLGDISGDGRIDICDPIMIGEYVIGITDFSTEQLAIADYNSDGKVNLYDAIAISKELLSNPTTPPSGSNSSSAGISISSTSVYAGEDYVTLQLSLENIENVEDVDGCMVTIMYDSGYLSLYESPNNALVSDFIDGVCKAIYIAPTGMKENFGEITFSLQSEYEGATIPIYIEVNALSISGEEIALPIGYSGEIYIESAPTEPPTEPPIEVICGDANLDGTVNVRDSAYIAYMLAYGRSSELPISADFNSDGVINVRDAVAIAVSLS